MDPLAIEISELETQLGAEQDPAKKTEISTKLEAKKAELEEKGKVPYYKLKETNDKLKAATEKLNAFEAAEKKRQEDEQKKNGEFEKLLQAKTAENETLNATLNQLKEQMRKEKVKSALVSEVSKHNPHDVEDVLRVFSIEESDLIDENGNIVIKGISSKLEKFKKEKPHLFKNTTNDKRDPTENNRGGAGSLESLMVEFSALNAKANLTPQETAKFRQLSEQIKELQKK